MEKVSRLRAIDSHTAAEPTRIIIEGMPEIPGATMPEKKAYLEENLDYVRTALMHEPRGHENMFGSIRMPKTVDEADFGIIFMDGGGYLNMCGHGTIGFCSAMVETKAVEVTEPVTNIVLEAPAGIVRAAVNVENGKAKSVSFKNVPAFLYKEDCQVELPGVGKVTFDISFGGSFFALVKASELGVEIEPQNSRKLMELGLQLRDIINKEIEIQHPTMPHIKTVDLVEIYGPAKSPDATLQNVVIFGQGQVDRSPCGTGTSAKLAYLYAKGEIGIDEEFVYESILGTKFSGRVLEETTVGEYKAVIPEITGSAYITGFNEFVIDETDPVKYGFTLG